MHSILSWSSHIISSLVDSLVCISSCNHIIPFHVYIRVSKWILLYDYTKCVLANEYKTRSMSSSYIFNPISIEVAKANWCLNKCQQINKWKMFNTKPGQVFCFVFFITKNAWMHAAQLNCWIRTFFNTLFKSVCVYTSVKTSCGRSARAFVEFENAIRDIVTWSVCCLPCRASYQLKSHQHIGDMIFCCWQRIITYEYGPIVIDDNAMPTLTSPICWSTYLRSYFDLSMLRVCVYWPVKVKTFKIVS